MSARKFDFAVTVTGAAGFVGSHLCRAFIESPYDVRVQATDLYGADMGRLVDLVGHDDFTYEEYNVHQPLHSDFLAVDTFYHLAGIANPEVYLEDPRRVMDLNLDGLRNVLERIVRWDRHRPRIVYTSTSEVYGRNTKVPFDEDESDLVFGPVHYSRWCYAMTKAVGEHYLRAYGRDGVRSTIFRLFNVVGTDIDELGQGRMLSRMIGDALEKGTIDVVEPGSQTRCFTWVDDVVELFVRPTFLKKMLITMPEHKPELYYEHNFRPDQSQTINAGSDQEVSMWDLAMLIINELQGNGITAKRQRVEREAHYGMGYDDVVRRVPRTDRAREVFGWSTRTNVNDIVERAVTAALLQREA